MHILLLSLGFGLVDAAVLSVSAIGFSLQFGMTNVLNLAYGAFMTIGAFTAYVVGHSIWLGFIAGGLVVGLLTLAVGRLVLRSFVKRGTRLFEMAIVTVGLELVLDYIMASITQDQTYRFTFSTGTEHKIFGMEFTTTGLVTIAVSVAIIALLELTLRHSKFGVAIRASAANGELAAASGIPIDWVMRATWLLSGTLCGAGGVLLAASFQDVMFLTGTNYLPYILAVVILAGIGSVGYAALVSLGLAVAVQVAGGFGAGSYNIVIALGALFVMLLIRPRGFFGELWEKTEVAA